MEEKIIISGKFTKTNIIAITCFALSVISLIISLVINGGDDYWLETAIWFDCPEGVGVFFYLTFVFIIIGIFFLIMMNSCEIVVTDKRVYGKSAFGIKIDLPLDKISSIGSCFPMGIKVATSSGIIRFWLLTNHSEVFSSISALLQKRQKPFEITENSNVSNADEIKKYKDLLDSGVITQEEFDAKKKQLLGL